MDTPGVSSGDAGYIDKKRKELQVFFKDAKFSQQMIDNVIENELKPLKEFSDKPYIAASAPGEVKTEYEVMTGQPFTQVDNLTKPLTREEIKVLLKDNPIIAEKAKQIQIVNKTEHREITIPIDEINLPRYSEMTEQRAMAADDKAEINKINYNHMQSLCNSVNNYDIKCKKRIPHAEVDTFFDCEDDDDSEYDAIEEAVCKYTNKSYETRFKETKEMLATLADRVDNTEPGKLIDKSDIILSNPVLRESSTTVVKGERRRSMFAKVKESYAINKDLNISLRDNPVMPNLSGEIKTNQPEKKHKKPDTCKTFEMRLMDTEKALQNLNLVFKTRNIPESIGENTFTVEDLTKNNDCNESIIENKCEIQKTNFVGSASQNFAEKLEKSLEHTLESIVNIPSHQNEEDKQMEVQEMKNLTRNIVEGADNLSIMINEDITNKLNSMNELLNDVNQALETSRKSDLAYQKLKEEGDKIKQASDIKNSQLESVRQKSTVTDKDIDDIQTAIGKLNQEIKCHEERVDKSIERYKMRNKECTEFMAEVDEVLLKSHQILHPTKDISAKTSDTVNKNLTEEKIVDQQELYESEKNDGKKGKEWDVNLDLSDETNKKLAVFKKQEQERSKRIDGLLHDIKDRMKDNKEVLRLANNLLRREEGKNKILEDNKLSSEVDLKAQGDFIAVHEGSEKNKVSSVSEVFKAEPTDSGEMKKKREADEERVRQREFQRKIEKDMEEMDQRPRMTKKFIRDHCRQHKLYCTPRLNDNLYLHFKGFTKIENLEEYTGLKCIFLNNNGIDKIEGLDNLSELRCLYLHYNVLRKIENLDGCPKLDSLNVEHNFIPVIENLDVVPVLHSLNISHNMLTTVDDLIHLRTCKNLSVLDLSYNRIEDPLIVDILADMDILKVLVLTGNPVIRNIPAYRKTLTLRLKELLNLDNIPVFPRDRACALAWQRGGVQEEIAERKRWIQRDQDKVNESVRYLIRIRDENLAKRQEREKEAREKLLLENPDLAKQHDEDSEKKEESFSEEEAPIANKYDKIVTTKDGIAEDMLSGSEAESSDSDESSSTSSDGHDDDDEGQKTGEIEWSQLNAGKRMVQEIKEETPQPVEEEYWYGYRGDLKPNPRQDTAAGLELDQLSNLLFNQTPHVESRKRVTKILDEAKTTKSTIAISEDIDSEIEKPNQTFAEKKPLIEVIESRCVIDEIKSENDLDDKIEAVTGIVKDKGLIIDHDRKIAFEESKEKPFVNVNHGDASTTLKKPLKKIAIEEVKQSETKNDSDNNPEQNDSNDTERPKNKSENNKEDDEVDGKTGEDKTIDAAGSSATSRPLNTEESLAAVQHNSGDGIALINYMRRMSHSRGDHEEYDDDNEDLKPSAEDLQIFEELDREQEEREARIARGEPPVDPMKLYDKKTMDEFHKAEDKQPTVTQNVKKKTMFTTYKHDNAFDRIALSQLTGGERPDHNKIKLTHVPGAVLFQYVDKPAKSQELKYEVGEENMDGQSSLGDTDIIVVSNKSISSTKVEETAEEAENVALDTDITIYETVKSTDSDSFQVPTSSTPKKDEEKQKRPRVQSARRNTDMPSTSYASMLDADRDEAKQSIIDTINSYEDERFPSQGVKYDDMAENARIDDTVAGEIFDRTRHLEEQEHYRHIDQLTSHAGRVDNHTNQIIEQISDQLSHELSLPDVSRIIEGHMNAAAQRWKAGEYVHYIPESPPESIIDPEEERTLVPSDTSFEDTLTEDDIKTEEKLLKIDEQNSDHENDMDIEDVRINDDSGIGNEADNSVNNNEEFERVEENYSIEMKLALGIDDKNV
ncbi:uncharacterized protein LOC105398845 [Plutella xylostella]|uniref:uncharacterized protein LOC105398845 n=1 Tax=Plutella xylostella TaxID=51655 RepID=UPI0020330A38|nr:uncharacterized protein LOC105398845 [Plutella xylostella]